MEALQRNVKRVETSVHGLEMIIDKPKLEGMLNGSVTLLLEAIVDMLNGIPMQQSYIER